MIGRWRTGIFPVLFFASAIAFTVAQSAGAQFNVRSWLPWRTIETRRFVFNYPTELDAWTRDLASHADAVAGAAEHFIGYAPPGKTQVVVDDPYEAPNGMAWPFIGEPVINLWAVAPDPREDIGEFRGWGETLLSHEYAHIAHLSRPSRNERWRRLWGLLPVSLGPIPVNAPAWVIEGYATLIEGRVTGSGRPHGSWRPAFLREWALEGQLPRYEQLSAFGGYEGGEFRYLAGSAFLEWLAARQGDSSLVFLWRRMTARETRSFDAAFVGVFGETPRALYGRFSTELTANAVEFARRTRSTFPADTGAIVQRLSWATGDPAISHDGKRVAITLRSPVASRIVIWGTAAEPDTGRARRDSILRARDPEDVPARAIYPPPKKALATLRASSGASFDSPRFLRDGRVLVERYVPTRDGTPRTDLYLWNPPRGSVARVTRGASVRLADPMPDGREAAAMRCAHGWCDLVLVDLASGDTRMLVPGNPARSFYRPRVSPDGRRIAVSVQDSARWRVEVVDAATGAEASVAVPGNTYDVAWMTDSTLAAVNDAGGIPNLITIESRTGVTRELSHVMGAAVAPEPNPVDRSIWFLSLYSSGYDLRSLQPEGSAAAAEAASAPGNVALDPYLGFAIRTAPVATPAFATNPVSAPHPYDAHARATRWAPLPFADADGVAAGLILANEDIIGRSQLLARGLAGNRSAWSGGSIDFTWRGARPFTHVHVFDASQRSNLRTAGALLSLDGTTYGETWGARWRIGASGGRIRTDTASARSLLFADAGAAWSQRSGARTMSESMSAIGTAGRTGGVQYTRGVATVGLSERGFLVLPVVASATYAAVTSGAPSFERMSLGGSPSPLLDRALLSQRVSMPALPANLAAGRSAFSYNITLMTQPLNAFYWAGTVGTAADPFSSWHRVIGLELSQSAPAIRSAAVPGVRAVLGAGESLDAPFRHELRGYINVFVTP